MGSQIVTNATTIMCGHAGSTTHTPTQMRVKVDGSLVATASDQHIVSGCSLASVPATFCTVLTWTVPAMRVKVGGQPVALHSSMPMGVGPGNVVVGQMRVTAT